MSCVDQDTILPWGCSLLNTRLRPYLPVACCGHIFAAQLTPHSTQLRAAFGCVPTLVSTAYLLSDPKYPQSLMETTVTCWWQLTGCMEHTTALPSTTTTPSYLAGRTQSLMRQASSRSQKISSTARQALSHGRGMSPMRSGQKLSDPVRPELKRCLLKCPAPLETSRLL